MSQDTIYPFLINVNHTTQKKIKEEKKAERRYEPKSTNLVLDCLCESHRNQNPVEGILLTSFKKVYKAKITPRCV